MIDIVLSKSCRVCADQLKAAKSLPAGSYQVIEYGSEEFAALPERNLVYVVPFVIARAADGTARATRIGFVSVEDLKKLASGASPPPFNLSRARRG